MYVKAAMATGLRTPLGVTETSMPFSVQAFRSPLSYRTPNRAIKARRSLAKMLSALISDPKRRSAS